MSGPKGYCTKKIMQALRDYTVALGRAPTQTEVRKNPDLPSDGTYLGIYPDWESVMAAMGFSVNWCSPQLRQKLLSELWQKYVEMDYHLPNPYNVQVDPKMEKMSVYLQVFGDFHCAWAAAGVWEDYCERQRRVIVATILRLRDELGRVPKLRDPGMPNEHLVRRMFGSYAKALVYCGLKPGYQLYARGQLIRQLQKKARQLGRNPTQAEVDADPEMASVNTFRREFGTYVKALKTAGLALEKAGHSCRYTRAGLIKQLQKKARKLGRAPTSREINEDPEMASVETFRRMFGSLKLALAEAGISTRRAKAKYARETLIAQLQRKAAELGRSPKQKEVSADPEMASVNTFIAEFGGFNAALEAAGLKLNRKRRAKTL